MYEFVNKPRPVIFHVLLALTLISRYIALYQSGDGPWRQYPRAYA
jgi:hypothetical protein